MTSSEFSKVIRDTPTFVPVFELTSIPVWAKRYGFEKGMKVYYQDELFKLKANDSFGLSITETYVKFINYEKI